ncbi:uncharacterized protein LOC127708363 [Mytilus californianus]|uniref:uncharacterized protein LOC127708363 n=1 Tax=Mytilus californianus TaxID=6549 RepID=UPI00224806BF|nr:uncharacterized protein LOC127708363 [Mytilus californianus]
MWFVNWLRTTNVTVIQYPYQYYCTQPAELIHERRRRQGRDALVLIMLENINSKHMTSPLRTLLDSTPCIRFKKGIGEDLFWKAVVEGLRKSIGQPPVSVL